jgi:hypothetical protein
MLTDAATLQSTVFLRFRLMPLKFMACQFRARLPPWRRGHDTHPAASGCLPWALSAALLTREFSEILLGSPSRRCIAS